MGLTGNKIHIRSYILAQEISINPSKWTTDIVQGHTLRIKKVVTHLKATLLQYWFKWFPSLILSTR
jgi:hypothetical protein